MSEEKEYYRPKEIEQIFGIKAVTVRSWFSKGVLKGAHLGKIILINASDLRDKIKQIEAGEDYRNIFSLQSHFGCRAPEKGA
jgi:hypothetical protein